VAHPGLILAATVVELLVWGGDGRLRLSDVAPQPWLVLVSEAGLVLTLLTQARSLRRCFTIVVAVTVLLALCFVSMQAFVGVLFVLYRAAHDLPAARAWPYAVLTGAPWAANTFSAAANVSPYTAGPLAVIVTIGLWMVITVVVWMAGRYGWNLAELATAREAAAIEQGRLALQEQQLKLARDVHDVVSHSVSAMMLQAAGARHSLHPEPPIAAVLETIETTGTSAMRELRGLLSLLAPVTEAGTGAEPGVPPSNTGGDIAALDQVLATTRACGIEVTSSATGTPRPLDPVRSLTGFRVIQEGLTNVIRHGGVGAQAEVQLAWGALAVTITVASHSTAPPTTPIGGTSGRGLDGLAVRLGQLGGELSHGPQENGSYLLRASLPYQG